VPHLDTGQKEGRLNKAYKKDIGMNGEITIPYMPIKSLYFMSMEMEME
jgi:hypothetical protein